MLQGIEYKLHVLWKTQKASCSEGQVSTHWLAQQAEYSPTWSSKTQIFLVISGNKKIHNKEDTSPTKREQ